MAAGAALLTRSLCLSSQHISHQRPGCRGARVGGAPSTPPTLPLPAPLGSLAWGWGGGDRVSLGWRDGAGLPAAPWESSVLYLRSLVGIRVWTWAAPFREPLCSAGGFCGQGWVEVGGPFPNPPRSQAAGTLSRVRLGGGLGLAVLRRTPGHDFRAQEAGARGAAGPRSRKRRPP